MKELRELLHKISWNILENFDNCVEKFRKLFQEISEDCERYCWHFREVISENFRKLFRTILRNILWSSRNITEIFGNYFEKFQKKFLKNLWIIAENFENSHKILRNISENFENCIAKFRKPFLKISENFQIYFLNRFAIIFWKISKIFSDNVEKYLKKYWIYL